MNNTNNNQGQGDDDAEAMRQSFEAFMLTGKKTTTDDEKEKGDDSSSLATTQSNKGKKKKKKKKQSLGSGGTLPKQPLSSTPAKTSGGSAPTSSPSTAKQYSKEKKRYYQLVRSFNDKVQHTWIDIDDQMLAVLQNIVSIRGRLPLEWKISHSSYLKDHNNQDPQDNDYGEENDWKHHGFLGKPKETPYSFHLLTSDVELALSNDVMQHEKMLVGLRSLISNLAECHDALGRALDTLWKFHLDCSTVEREGEEEHDKEGDNNMQHMVDCVTNVYQMLSMELYRKQCLVPLIIESADDEILGIEKEKPANDVGSGSHSLKAASKCSKSWKRGSEESCIDDNLLMHVLKLGETVSTR